MTNKLTNALARIRNERDEEKGFTLIELMIVVVIIGILAAIAIPVFATQQKTAIAATVKTDVRNTVADVATLMVKHPTATQADLASVITVKSRDNVVSVGGQWDDYTVVGYNAAVEGFVVYHSVAGKTTTETVNPLKPPKAIQGVGSAPDATWYTVYDNGTVKCGKVNDSIIVSGTDGTVCAAYQNS